MHLNRRLLIFPVILTLLVITSGISLLWGQIGIASLADLSDALFSSTPHSETAATLHTVIWEIRLPRLVLALIIGANLAVAGALLQSLFHNPMADPYVMGISSGAGFGATLAFALGLEQAFMGLHLTSWMAFAFALATAIGVYSLTRRQKNLSISTLLLTGIAIGGIIQSLTTLLILQANVFQSKSIISWLMGSLAYRGWEYPLTILPQSLIALAFAWSLHRSLNLLATGEESAHWLGLNVERLKIIILILAAMLSASSVACCGIIGFVGLLVPHVVRLLTGSNHSILLPASMLTGSWVLLVSDLIARNLLPNQEVPIGIVTGVLGCLLFLHLLRSQKSRIL